MSNIGSKARKGQGRGEKILICSSRESENVCILSGKGRKGR